MPRPTAAGSSAGKVRTFIFGLLASGLLGAAGLGFAGFRVHQLNAAVSDYPAAASLYRVRTAAVHQLSDMETAFNRFLLDGNSANLSLLERDRESVEQLAQQDPELKADKILQDMVAKEQQWYVQVAQPLMQQRKGLPAGQGLSEDFLARYRTSNADLGVISFEVGAEHAFRDSLEGLVQSERHTSSALSVTCLVAGVLLMILTFVLASGALRQVGGLQRR